MNISKEKRFFDDEDVREIELKLLKSKIIDAIRFSEHFWMIYKERTFGIATILDLIYKKTYIEILFFTNIDFSKRGIPLIKINTPTKTTFNFNEILIGPNMDEDGLISPKKVIEKVNYLIEKEIKYHLTILNYEVQLLNESIENYSIGDNPYFRKINVYYPNFIIKLRVNFENYPEIPSLPKKKQLVIKRFHEPLMERIKDRIIEKYGIMTYDQTGEEIEIYDTKDEIIIEKYDNTYIKKLSKRFKINFEGLLKRKFIDYDAKFSYLEKIVRIKDFNNMDIIKNWNIEDSPHMIEVIKSILEIKEGSQHLLLNNVSIQNKFNNLTFKIHRGQSIGIFYESIGENQIIIQKNILNLFEAIAGINKNFSGIISIFGKEVKSESNEKINRISIISENINPKFNQMRIKKALFHDLYLIGKKKSKKRFLKKILENTGLLNRKNEKVSVLNELERILFLIARDLLRKQEILMILIPPRQIGRLEIEQFNRYIEKIKRIFHIVILIYGPKSIVSNCDRILMIKNNEAEIGTLKDFISKIPQNGEIITIELEHPKEATIDQMLKLKSAMFIEERKNERYKIFSTENPNILILKLMDIIGSYIYNFKRDKATLEDYLEFLEIESQNVNISK